MPKVPTTDTSSDEVATGGSSPLAPLESVPADARPVRTFSPAILRLDKILYRMIRVISGVCAGVLAVLLFVMVATAALQVFSRYVVPVLVGGPEEIARTSMIAMVFLGLPVLARHSEHIRLDLAQEMIKNAVAREWISRLVLLLELVFLIFLSVLAWEFVASLAESPQRSPALGLRTFYTRFPLLIGAVLGAIVTAAVLVRRLMGTDRSEIEAAPVMNI